MQFVKSIFRYLEENSSEVALQIVMPGCVGTVGLGDAGSCGHSLPLCFGRMCLPSGESHPLNSVDEQVLKQNVHGLSI